MKKPPVNLYQKQLILWLSKHAFLSRFKRYWGTTTVDGIEVFSHKIEVYPDLSSKTRQLLKMLRILDQILSQKYKGVDSAWLYLNPDKTHSIPITVQDIKEAVNTYINELLEQASGYNTLIPRDYLHTFTISVASDSGIRPIVTPDNIENYLQTHQIEFSNVFAFIQFLLTPTTFSDVVNGRVEVSERDRLSGEINITYKLATVCIYKLPVKSFDIDGIAIKLKEFLDIEITGRRSRYKVNNHDLNILNIQREASFITPTSRVSDNIWLVEDSRTYLKTSFLRANVLNLDRKIEILTKIVDFNYRKKEADFWSKLAVIVVTIVAAVLAVPTGGASLTAIAVIMVVVSVTLSVTALLMRSWGDYGGSNFANNANTMISPFVQIAQFVLLIKTGINLVKSIAEVGKQEAVKTVGGQAVTATSSQISTEIAVSTVNKEVVTETTTIASKEAVKTTTKYTIDHLLSKIDIKFVLETLKFTTDLWSRNKVQEVKRKNRKLENEIAEFEEGSKQNDLAQQFMDTYTEQLKSDWSEYSEIYDRPYEPTTPKFHIGNIQATTVTAFNYIS